MHASSWRMRNGLVHRVFVGCLLASAALLLHPGYCWAGSAVGVSVTTTILPLVEMVEEIGGESVTVGAMVPPGASPHTWEPLPGQLEDLARADLYVEVGSGIEFELTWVPKLKAMNSQMGVVDASRGIPLRQMEQDSGGKDPHVWLSLRNAVTICEHVSAALAEVDPERSKTYNERKNSYVVRLRKLDASIARQFEEVKRRRFIVLHPAWGYFARDYGLEQIVVNAAGKQPGPRQIARIVDLATATGIKTVFVSPQFSGRNAEVIAKEIGGHTVIVDPLAKDYLANMERVAKEIALALRQ